jgi:hypothetical protein
MNHYGDCGCGAPPQMGNTEQEDAEKVVWSVGLTLGVACLVIFPIVGYILWKEAQEG